MDLVLSEPEKVYISNGIQDNIREDGRSNDTYRLFQFEPNIISTANGSVRLRVGNTELIAAVKAELDTPLSTRPNEGRLEFFVDISANASPVFEGRGGEDVAANIVTTLDLNFQSGALDLESLCLLKDYQCWLLHVDISVLECDGNLHDAAVLASKLALAHTALPDVQIEREDTGHIEITLPEAPLKHKRIDASNVPLTLTVSKVGHSHIVDATLREEHCCLARLIVCVAPNGNVSGIRKEGFGSLDPRSVMPMLETARSVGLDMHKVVQIRLASIGDVVRTNPIGYIQDCGDS